MEKIKKQNNIYSSFMFVKLDPLFRRLISNEKIAAKQEFENMAASCQEKLFFRTYMLAGLCSDSDILLWRMSDDLEFLQENCARTFSTGAGRYFLNAHSFLGVHQAPEQAALKKDLEFGFLPKESFGLYKFMLIHPVVKSHVWYELSEEERSVMLSERACVVGRYREIRENFFTSYGLGKQEMIVAREARHLDELINATRELRELRIKGYTAGDTPVFLCVGRDLREILDAIS